MIKDYKAILVIFALFLGTLILASPSSAQESEVRKELEALYAKRDAALKAKDVAYITSLETDDFTRKSKDGKTVDRKQADAEMDMINTVIKEVTTFKTTLDDVKQGENGEVTVLISDKGALILIGDGNQEHKVEGSGKGRDVWVKTDQGWKIKSHEEVESNTTVDGKPA
jgi:ketosteroid isomerase-like protein